MRKLISKECKFVTHLYKTRERPDTHVIKEVYHYDDGTSIPNLKVVSDFKRPYYITKKFYQKHKDKKESESIDKLDVHYSTQSDLGKNIATRLGAKYVGISNLRDVVDSPYVYGTDISTKAIIKQEYLKAYPDAISSNSLAVLDIEADVRTKVISVITLAMNDKIYTVINKSMLANTNEPVKQLEYLYNKYIPDTDIKKKAKVEYLVVENELECIKTILKVAHKWGPDFIAIWNMDYDIPAMVKVLHKNDVDPATVFSDPSLPPELHSFKYVEGQKQKLTESGKFTPVNPEEQWHRVEAPAKFYWIDAMSAHRYVRAGGKTMPGGYSLDNILRAELGARLAKLKFANEVKHKGVSWHIYMATNKPLEYIVYNQWDCMSMLELDKKTNDLSMVITMLSGISDYGIFNSGPKKIIDAMHYFYLERGKVLATKPARIDGDKLLGLGNWIVLLPSYRVKENGLTVVTESPLVRVNTRAHVFDSDCVSSYPSDTVAGNVSRETTTREVLAIKGIDKDTFMLQNINLFFGEVNSVQYCSTMYNFPKLTELWEAA